VVHASAAGLITAPLWELRHRRHGRRVGPTPTPWLPLAAAVALVGDAGVTAAGLLVTNLVGLIVLWAATASVMLLALRIVLHGLILDEARRLDIGDPIACPECHRMVPFMGFCPACGIARTGTPKKPRGGD
jgi:FAD/FMN-containing dehydrogenase